MIKVENIKGFRGFGGSRIYIFGGSLVWYSYFGKLLGSIY